MNEPDTTKLLKQLDLKFKDQNIFRQIFIHRSYLNEVKMGVPSNERLEFLGDSVLSLVVSDELFKRRAQDAEGQLTNLRAYIVKTNSLAAAAKKLNLGKFLLLSKGEELGGGRENLQILANTYEALLGAIFLDQGLEKTREFIKGTLLSLFGKELKEGPPKDAKSKLQEVIQEKFRASPYYKTVKTYGPDHAKQFEVAVHFEDQELGRGKGFSKQEAEEKAAKVALEKMSDGERSQTRFKGSTD